jgi:hypothetical protein|tara:strand:- start:25 stop:366 length:342 start_codon:yes stop_codon:yes gene_type:complete
MMSALDEGPDYYRKTSIQPIEYILDHDLGFAEGCIVKYISRWKDKGGVEDLRKIKHYCDFLIEREVNDLPGAYTGIKRAARVEMSRASLDHQELIHDLEQQAAESQEVFGVPV